MLIRGISTAALSGNNGFLKLCAIIGVLAWWALTFVEVLWCVVVSFDEALVHDV